MAQSTLVIGTGAKALQMAVISVDNDRSTALSWGAAALLTPTG